MSNWKSARYGYEASETGEIRNGKGRLMKQTLLPDGRLYVNLRRLDQSQKFIAVSILVCEAFHGPKPGDSLDVAHYDCNQQNNHASNLRWATRKENMEDCRRNGCI